MKKLYLFTALLCLSIASFAQTYTMPTSGSASATTCSGNFYDSGGSGGFYLNGESGSYTFFPGSPGSKVILTFSSYSTECGYDYLYIYNGNSTAAPLLYTANCTTIPPTYTSSAADGSLTVRFSSDGSVTSSGWAATISCLVPPPSVFSSPSSLAFGAVSVGATSAAQVFSVTGVSLTPASGNLTVTAPAGFSLATTLAGTYSSSVLVPYTSGGVTNYPLYAKFSPAAYSTYSGNIAVTGGGAAAPANTAVTGTGVFPCSGTPSIGSAAVSPTSGGIGTTFALSIPALTSGDITYQWQMYDPTSSSFFTNITGATTATYSQTGITNNTYFRVIVTCPAGGSVTSNIVLATLSPAATACTGLPTPGNINADVPAGCAPSYISNLYYTGADASSGYTYQWQSSSTGPASGFSNIPGAISPFYTATVTATKWYQLKVTCTGSGGSSFTTSQQLTLNPLPGAITGNMNVCTSLPSTLTSTTPGGSWTSGNTAIAVAGLGTGIISGVSPGVANITYTLSTGCNAITTVSVNTSPASVIGSSNVCEGGTLALTDPSSGGTWSSSNSGFASVNSASGVVTGVAAGNPSISYTLSNGCFSVAPITVNPLPLGITGTNNVCIGANTNLADATPGGSWSSSNTFQAAVGATSGIVSGVAAGTPNILYTLPTGCSSSIPVTVNALPLAITGAGNVCVGSTTTLTDGGTGTWSSAPTSVASVASGSGAVSGIAAGTATVTYTLAGTGCKTTMPITVNALPASYNVTGGGGYCSGTTTGVHVGLSNSQNSVNYQLYLTGTGAVGAPVAGSSSGLDFGLFTATGTYTVQATAATGCTRNMPGVAIVSVTPLPTDHPLGGGGGYCAGTGGVHITLPGSDAGVNYQLYYGVTAIGAPVAGTGSGTLDLGIQTAAGVYTVKATNTSTLCNTMMTGSSTIFISPIPAAHNVTGGGSYCLGGTGVSVTLDSTTAGVDYQLYRDGILTGAVVPGTGGLITFPLVTTGGNYTVSATDVTNGCHNNMRGSTAVFTTPLPDLYTVTGGGNYCAGTPGVHIGLNNSTIGTSYELLNTTLPTGIIATGSSSGLDFGLQTATGTYTVKAKITATGCTTTMLGSTVVGINAVPLPFLVTGGGGYCTGSAGVGVGLSGTEVGIKYQLYRDGVSIGTPLTGAGSALPFGIQTIPGVYTIVAFNPTSLCPTPMTGTAVVSINPLPLPFTVSGGGNYCLGGAGMHIILSGSTTGVNYQLYVDGTPVGAVMAGTGSALDFGLRTTAGMYTVTAVTAATCSRIMNGSATIGINPLPAPYSVTGGGSYCSGSAGKHVGLALSNMGVSYQLFNSGTGVSTLAGTGTSLDYGVFTATGTYTIVATNTVSGCSSAMTGSAVINMNLPPTPFTLTGGGILCAGGTGVPLDLSGSATGVQYRLYNSGTPVGGIVTGTGSILNFGPTTVAGTYTVKATDATTTCTSNMAGSITITVNAAPSVYNVSGGGNYCAGGTGMHINLSNSDLGVQYQIWNGVTPEGTFWAGTGLPLDMGAHTTAGTFKVVATNVGSGCSSNMNDSAVIGIIPTVAPAVTIVSTAPMPDTVCAGTSTTFSAIPTNGGTLPAYQWKVNGTATGTGGSYAYTPVNGDMVSVTMTSNAVCPSSPTATDLHTITVAIAQIPLVSITANPGATVCPGVAVTYTATPVFGGSAPSYVWKKNSATVSTSNTYSYMPADGDVVYAVMNTSYFCASGPFALSNDVVMNVTTPVMPTFTVLSDPGTTAVQSHDVTFMAIVDDAAGVAPTYKWKVNGVVVATATNATFTTSTLANNDVVCAEVTGHNSCGASAPATHCQTMNITSNLGVNTVTAASDIKVMPNPNKGAFAIKGTIGTGNDEVAIEVTNMLGQVVYSSKVMTSNGVINEQVQLSNSLANGMYLLNIRSRAENKTIHFVIGQ